MNRHRAKKKNKVCEFDGEGVGKRDRQTDREIDRQTQRVAVG